MGPPVAELLVVPVALWAALAGTFAVALRRARAPVVLRVASLFLALWAVLATTTLAWVLTHGGLAAVVSLAERPLGLFAPAALPVWLEGAVGAFGLLTAVFLLNQVVGRGLLTVLRPTPLPWPGSLPMPSRRISLRTFDSGRLEAFSFALVEVGPHGRPRRHEVILLSRELLRRLTPEERDAVLAHEVGHLLSLDGRYLTYLRTLARLMRWDPVIGYVVAVLTRHEEFRADVEAAERTRRPLALARALAKSADLAFTSPVPGAVRFAGASGRGGRAQVVERIERLLTLHRTGRYAEEPRGPA